MPAGHLLASRPARIVEKATAQTCLEIARRVHRARRLSGDEKGSDAARLVARLIQEEFLEGEVQTTGMGMVLPPGTLE